MGRESTRLGTCKWYTNVTGSLYNTGMQDNTTVVQRQGAENEWIFKGSRAGKRRCVVSPCALKRIAYDNCHVLWHGAHCLFPFFAPVFSLVSHSLLPSPPFSVSSATQHAMGAALTPMNLGPDEKDSLADRRLFSRTPGDPYVRSYLMSREFDVKEKVRRTQFAEYTRIQTSNNGKDSDPNVTFGRDFLGCRRVIDPKHSRASSSLERLVTEPDWLPFRIERAEATRQQDARPSPLNGRKIADFLELWPGSNPKKLETRRSGSSALALVSQCVSV